MCHFLISSTLPDYMDQHSQQEIANILSVFFLSKYTKTTPCDHLCVKAIQYLIPFFDTFIVLVIIDPEWSRKISRIFLPVFFFHLRQHHALITTVGFCRLKVAQTQRNIIFTHFRRIRFSIWRLLASRSNRSIVSVNFNVCKYPRHLVPRQLSSQVHIYLKHEESMHTIHYVRWKHTQQS